MQLTGGSLKSRSWREVFSDRGEKGVGRRAQGHGRLGDRAAFGAREL